MDRSSCIYEHFQFQRSDNGKKNRLFLLILPYTDGNVQRPDDSFFPKQLRDPISPKRSFLEKTMRGVPKDSTRETAKIKGGALFLKEF